MLRFLSFIINQNVWLKWCFNKKKSTEMWFTSVNFILYLTKNSLHLHSLFLNRKLRVIKAYALLSVNNKGLSFSFWNCDRIKILNDLNSCQSNYLTSNIKFIGWIIISISFNACCNWILLVISQIILHFPYNS